jgi:polysaccharide export outer membrane protein
MLQKRPIRISAVALALAVCGCSTTNVAPDLFAPKPKPTASFTNIGYANWSNAEPPYRLYPGDELDVQVPSAPELSKTVVVQPDGRISLPLLTPIEVTDRTLPEVEQALSRAYAGQLLRPQVNIAVKAQPLRVFVGGEVARPGVYDMPGDINALQAVILAGGFTNYAKRGQVVIIRRGLDGRAMMRTANLQRSISDPGQTDAVPLRRFDIIYVPRTRIAEAGLFVQQYLRDINPISIGFNYAVGSTYTSAAVAPVVAAATAR